MNYSKYMKYFYSFIVIVAIGILYEKYNNKNEENQIVNEQELIQKFLLSENSYLGGKPNLWIHTTLDINARNWKSFFSRNTRDLNQPYILLCIQSIVNKCSDSFNICLIDDSSFEKLIPGWRIDLDEVADPVKTHLRTLGLMKVLYYYGGLLCPNSVLALQNFKDTYYNSLKYRDCFVGTFVNRSSVSIKTMPSHRFMGCKRNSKIVKEFIQFLEILNSKDYTNTPEFIGMSERFLFKVSKENDIVQLPAQTLCVIDKNNKLMVIDELLSDSYYQVDEKECIGIYLPADEILKRFKYQWFARMSCEQILDSDLTISKYFLTSVSEK